MQVLVIHDSKFGNTEKVAEAIARGAAAVAATRVVAVADAAGALAARPDLVFIGGPTQRRGMSPALRAFVERLSSGSLADIPVAAFDTRYRGTTIIMGSAAAEIAKRAARLGGRRVALPESFFVARGGPIERQGLEAGELDRAAAWGLTVVTSDQARAVAPARSVDAVRAGAGRR